MAIRIIAAWAILGVLVAADGIWGQEVGDKILTLTDYDTKIRDNVVGKIKAGSVHRVIAVENSGKTVWIHLENLQGWVPIRVVRTLPAAEKELSARLQQNPRDIDALATRGLVRFELGQVESALVDFDRARQLAPDSAVIHNNLGRLFKAMSQYDQALTSFSEALRIDPQNAHARFNRGLVYYSVGDYTNAIKDYDDAIQLDAKDPWFFINRGHAQHAHGKEEEALGSYSQAEHLNSRIPEIYLGRSNVYLGQNKLQEALAMANRALEFDPEDAATLNTRGWVFFKLGRLDDAQRDLDKAIQVAPTLALPYTNRGVVFTELKQYENAIRDFNRSLSLQPEIAIVFVNRGNAWMNLGEYAKAKADYAKALELAPEIPESRAGLSWFLATCPDNRFRDGKLALELASKLCEQTQNQDANYLHTLAAAQAETGDFEQASQSCKEAIAKAGPALKQKFTEDLERLTQKQPLRHAIQ